jgi:hypothetical protein
LQNNEINQFEAKYVNRVSETAASSRVQSGAPHAGHRLTSQVSDDNEEQLENIDALGRQSAVEIAVASAVELREPRKDQSDSESAEFV